MKNVQINTSKVNSKRLSVAVLCLTLALSSVAACGSSNKPLKTVTVTKIVEKPVACMEYPPEWLADPVLPENNPVCVDDVCTLAKPDLVLITRYVAGLVNYIVEQLIRCDNVVNESV